jgi:twitching motility protein PilT
MDVSELLIFAFKEGASDLHMSAGEAPIVRINGDIRKLEIPPLSKEEVRTMLYDILNDHQRKTFEETLDMDFSLSLGEYGRFRVNLFLHNRGMGAVFRTIPTKIYSFEQLGLPRVCRDMCNKEKGLVLVTGPTGCGKSTTLAAMIDLINNEHKGHIITIEDPIEFVHDSKNCLISQREVGPHTHSFANALRSALREDPDIILVGEMRDLETISLALTAAETGHLVFATLHTSSAPKTIDRVIDVFPAAQQGQIRTMLAESIQAVFSQVLLKRKGGKGRILALEIMIGTPAVKNLIREAKISQIPSMMQTGQKFGMQTLEAAIKDLLARNLVEPDEVTGLMSDTVLLTSKAM